MATAVEPLPTVAEHGHVSAWDRAVAAEVRGELRRQEELRRNAGDLTASFTQGELADLAHMPVSQVRRRLRGEASFTVDDVVVLAEALGIEGYALFKAATMRRRALEQIPPHDPPLRDQVLEGPGGLPIIQ